MGPSPCIISGGLSYVNPTNKQCWKIRQIGERNSWLLVCLHCWADREFVYLWHQVPLGCTWCVPVSHWALSSPEPPDLVLGYFSDYPPPHSPSHIPSLSLVNLWTWAVLKSLERKFCARSWALPTNKWECGTDVLTHPQFPTEGMEYLKKKLPLSGHLPRQPRKPKQMKLPKDCHIPGPGWLPGLQETLKQFASM